MTTLFYDNFANTKQWTTGSIVSVLDPLDFSGKVASFSSVTTSPQSHSKVIYNTQNSYQISFDYLGLSNNINYGINLGCILSINDGASIGDVTIAYAGAIKNSAPPDCGIKIMNPNNCINPCQPDNGICSTSSIITHEGAVFKKTSSFVRLVDNGQWNSYNFSFSTTNTAIRVTLSDYRYGDGRNEGVAGDCYFKNLLITDSAGPSLITPVPPTSVPPAPILQTPVPSTLVPLTLAPIAPVPLTPVPPAPVTPIGISCSTSNSQCNVDLSHSTITAAIIINQNCNQVNYCIAGSVGNVYISANVPTYTIQGFNKNNNKLDVSAFDCISEALTGACYLSGNNKVCSLHMIDRASNGGVEKGSKIVLENLGIDFVLDKGSFLGRAVDHVCSSDAQSVSASVLGILTALLVLWEM